MTYNVFGGTLNPTLLLYCIVFSQSNKVIVLLVSAYMEPTEPFTRTGKPIDVDLTRHFTLSYIM